VIKMSKAGKAISGAQSKANKMTSAYKNSSAYKNAQWLQHATIQDIAKKYGFDFSQAYANKQAETAAQAQRNQYNAEQRTNNSSYANTMKGIQDAYDSSASGLDTNYFKQFGANQQDQANRGLNAGIAANQDLQLGMSKQKDLADLWKQTNTNRQQESMRYANENQTISEALAQVEKQKALDAQNNYQNLLKQGYDILNGDRTQANSWAATNWDQTQAGINNMMDLTKMNVNDIYNQQDQANQAANRAAAARNARIAAGGGSSSGVKVPSSAQPYVTSYNKAKTPTGQSYNTPVDQYAQSMMKQPGFKAVQQSPSPLVHKYFPSPVYDPTAPANNPNLSAWDKMKLLGL
jgi:hypothetical protein